MPIEASFRRLSEDEQASPTLEPVDVPHSHPLPSDIKVGSDDKIPAIKLVQLMQELLASEVKSPEDRNVPDFTSRQLGRLVNRSWPEFQGQFVVFENSRAPLNVLPVDLLLDIVGQYCTQLEIYGLARVALMFAMPQPSLRHAQTFSFTALAHSDHLLRCLSREDPRNFWLRAAHTVPMVRCLVVREPRRFGNLSPSTFSLYLQDSTRGNEMLLLVAIQRGNFFHIFNVAKGHVKGRLSRGGGNHIGTLCTSFLRREYVLVSADGACELGALTFRREEGTAVTWTQGPQPRRCHFAFPVLDTLRFPVRVAAASATAQGMLAPLRQFVKENEPLPSECFVLRTKEPLFDAFSNSYRLNFHGRVTVPSIKNMQIVHNDDPDEILCQFGKTDKHRFHLDYRRPFNAMQAFCVALASFSHY